MYICIYMYIYIYIYIYICVIIYPLNNNPPNKKQQHLGGHDYPPS